MSAADRQEQIRALFVQQPGPLRTGDIWKYCHRRGIAPCRTTVRRDLEQMARQGVLRPEGPDHDRVYWLRSLTGGGL